ncbi:phospholipase [Halostreptopolyspora alba]|uniref:Phospholipase n=1 Tax=Halostreptopolyspora alba TaxID=2487137 RepID=A0A3N0EIP2_9ACTN|nr:phospholipase [Nocardiopsaceae bacterium YIM 96095]
MAVLTVHGRGQSPESMRDLTARLGAPPARFYAPAAPEGSWYPHPFMEPLARNQPELDHGLRVVEAVLTRILREGFARHRVVLWGFSQGACLLSQYLLDTPRRLGGAILFTGGHLGPDARPAPSGAPLDGLPVLMRSVERDPWVPRSRVAETAELLRRAGATVDLRIAPGDEHVVTDEACGAAARLLRAIGQ